MIGIGQLRSGPLLRRFGFLFALMIAPAGCAQRAAQADKLASEGSIEEAAPVKAEAEIIIAAPQAKVWKLLTDVKDWPKWQPDIADTSIQRDPAVDTTFAWSGGTPSIPSYGSSIPQRPSAGPAGCCTSMPFIVGH
jgi:uncharacterized membrane protein